MGLGDFISAGGQAVKDLFSSEGASAEANSFTQAAQLAQQNASLTAASTRIQQTQAARNIFQTEGAQIADVAGAGFTESGSALDLLRSSAQQGSLTEALTNIQGAISENSYAAQAGAYQGAAAAAKENATANTVGAIASIGGALVNNSQSLVSAGKTVVQGVNSVYDSIFGSSADTTASDLANLDSFWASQDAADSAFASSLDQAVSGGSDLSETLASSDIGIDTSGLGIGTDLSSAFSGITDAIGSISDSVAGAIGDVAGAIGDFLPGVGLITGASQLLNMIPGWSSIPVLGDITKGITNAVGDVTNFVGGALGDIGSAVGGALSDVGNAIGGALGSVICTAYYKQGFISRRVWLNNQRYGAACDPVTFQGYHIWGKPVAKLIQGNRRIASLLFPIFKPAIYEMAGISTISGRFSLRFFLAFSNAVGKIKERKGAIHAVNA